MSVRVLQSESGEGCLYCSTTMWAFGPVFNQDEDPQEFLDWLKVDPRHFNDTELAARYSRWIQSKNVPAVSEDEEDR